MHLLCVISMCAFTFVIYMYVLKYQFGLAYGLCFVLLVDVHIIDVLKHG